jgi:branched-chain amino acid transport system ATP-binding protein
VVVVTPLLSVENVSKSFGGLKAIDDVSLTVSSGEICSVIGPNGAGKTTLFNIISGVLRPSTGRIVFNGTDLAGISPWRFAAVGIGRTFQNLALFKHGTAVENILTGRHTHLRSGILDAVLFFGRTRAEEIDARRRVEEIIEFLKLSRSAIPWSEHCRTVNKSASNSHAPWRANQSFCYSMKWSLA